MGRDTKIGLLVGMCFIVCFAVILSNRGEVDVSLEPAGLQVSTIVSDSQLQVATAAPPPRTAAQRTNASPARTSHPTRTFAGLPPRGSRGTLAGSAPATERSLEVAESPAFEPDEVQGSDASSTAGQVDVEGRERLPAVQGNRFVQRGRPIDPSAVFDPQSVDLRAAAPHRWAARPDPPEEASDPAEVLAELFQRYASSEASQDEGVQAAAAVGDEDHRGSSDVRPDETETEDAERGPAPGAARDLAGDYTVQPGDTLMRLARTHYGSGDQAIVDAIFAANRDRLADADHVAVGSKLKLPAIETPAQSGPARRGDAAAKSEDANVAHDSGTVVPKTRAASRETAQGREGVDWRWYRLKKGDVYSTVAARQLGTAKRWPELAQLNRDIFPDAGAIRSGVRIRVPIKKGGSAPHKAASGGA